MTRKLQIQAYRTQLALTVELKAVYEADMENDEKGGEFAAAAAILNTMREAGYAPRPFGADTLETGNETPEQLEEYREAMSY